jgi:arsenate reductase (thioredoxin)
MSRTTSGARHYALELVAASVIVVGPALVRATAEHAGEPVPAASPAKATRVLFVCEHGAGKSVLAAAYFAQLAKERGLDVKVDSAGTAPDAAVAPVVATHLEKQGYEVPIAKPRQATAADLATADIVVTMGCELKGLPKPTGRLLKWDEVPGPGQDLSGAEEAIRKRTAALAEELSQQKRSQSR